MDNIPTYQTDDMSSLDTIYVCVGFLVSFSLWYIASAIVAWYRLRHIPGSFFASFSYLWMTKSILLDTLEKDLSGLKTCGMLVRIGLNSVVTSNPEALRRIASARSRYTKDEWYASARFSPDQITMVILFDNHSHNKQKAKSRWNVL
ncbi:hypothetical protein GGR54DRAFT_594839 [Hypoxylon sp. NC1633]|nr:hypothetical protein GGR54DRAFT_594839 [Hypoxylon sp. NC1633]